MCENEQVIIVTPKNVHFEDVSFFIKASDEEKFLLFQHGEINGKLGMSFYCLMQECRFNDNIDPKWSNEVCNQVKCS